MAQLRLALNQINTTVGDIDGNVEQVLRGMPTALFSLLTCLSPIAAALTAWAVRGQELTPLDLAGMLLVIAACAAAVWTGRSPGVAGGG